MVSPSLVLIALVAVYPILYAIWLSLHQYSLIEAGLTRWAEPNAPFGNYTEALWGADSSQFWTATRITFVFTIVSVFFELVIGLAMAMAMHAAFKGQGVLRTVILVPWAVLTVVTAITWQTIFESELGFVNSMLGAVGLPNDTVWLGEEPEALIVMIIADVWKTAPFMALLILAGLQVIPGEIYEAGKVDGLRIFDLPWVLTKGAHGTETLSLISYQTFQQNRLVGEGSALAVLTFVIVMAVSFLYIRFIGGNLRTMAEE
jgi:multiple sugar transport system permease protein